MVRGFCPRNVNDFFLKISLHTDYTTRFTSISTALLTQRRSIQPIKRRGGRVSKHFRAWNSNLSIATNITAHFHRSGWILFFFFFFNLKFIQSKRIYSHRPYQRSKTYLDWYPGWIVLVCNREENKLGSIDRSLPRWINVVNTGTKHESGLPPATIYDHVSHCHALLSPTT